MNTNSISKTAQNKNLSKAWIVCISSALYFFYMFIQITKLNAIGNAITAEFKINSSGLGFLSSMYFWGNIIFILPSGILLDRFSTKKILIISAITCIGSIFLFSLTHNITLASYYFFITGMTGTSALTPSLRLISRWFPPEKTAFVSGVIVTIGFFGAIVSQSPLIWLERSNAM